MCREKCDKKSLLRIIRTPEGKLEFDPTGKHNGRGAYLCRREECLSAVKNRKKIMAALEISPSEEEMKQTFDAIENYIMREKLKGEGK